jgi:hypothetical protein
MKKGNKFFKVASRFAVPTLIALMLVSAATIFWGLGVLPNMAKTKKFNFFGRFIMYYNNGTLPDRDDVALIGRENTDIVLKNSELRLRCGYKKNPTGQIKNRLHFNKIDPAYIQLKYKKIVDNDNNEINSVINVVADRINLLSRDSKNYFKLTDQKDLITDDELLNILDTAHPLIYGDELVSFLKKFLDLFSRHTHPFSMMPPSFNKADTDTLAENLNDMLSKAVRIN